MRFAQIANITIFLLLAVEWVFFIIFSFYRFLGVGPDDVFIFLWTGENFSSYHWFVNYNFQTQEMMSSIVVPLIIALIKFFIPENMFFLFYKIAGLFSVSMLVWILWAGRDYLFGVNKSYLFGVSESDIVAFFCISATVFSPIVQYWSLGGMETSYQLVLYTSLPIVIVSFLENNKSLNCVGLISVQILIILVRVEGFLFVLLSTALLIFFKYKIYTEWNRKDVLAIFTPLAFFLILLLVRWLATGAIWPNPVLAKVGTFDITIPLGFDYIFRYYFSNPLAFFCGVGLVIAGLLSIQNFVLIFYGKQSLLMPLGLTVATILVIAQDIFVILVGGNWMELFRFMAPTFPLKSALLAWLVYQLIKFAPRFSSAKFHKSTHFLSIFLFSLLFFLILTQQYILDTKSKMQINEQHALPDNFFKGSIDDINQKARILSEIIKMEVDFIKFMEGPLREIVSKQNKQLVFISSQAGLLPYTLRKYYSKDQIWFVDPLGLASKELAELSIPKAYYGNVFSNVDEVLLGRAGKLSEEVIKKNPDIVCILNPTPEAHKNLTDKLGFQLIFDQAGCTFYYKNTNSG